MFPLTDPAGRRVGWGGRSVDGADPKWLYWWTAHGAERANVFGSERLLEERVSEALVVEGILDAALLWQAGIPALALHGTKVKPEQVWVMRALGLHRLLICGDGDAEGRRMNSKLEDAWGTDCVVVDLPEGEDPASLLLVGELEDCISRATS